MKIAHVINFRGPSSPSAPSLPSPDRFPAYAFSQSESSWLPASTDVTSLRSDALRFATYNVLEDERFPFPSRAASIVDAILESDADVIALQEISALSLRSVLESSTLRERGYCWCTHGPSAVFPLHRNLAVLSRIPFALWNADSLGDKLKPIVILSLPRISGPNLTVVALHLSAGYSPEISSKRAKEVTNLVTLLHSQYASDDWVVLGDTNLQALDSNPDSSALEDTWEVAGSRPDLEATFEPELNHLAAQTSRQDSSPKRYDRIFIRSGRFTVESFARFGLPSSGSASPGSDHWGVVASLRLGVSTTATTEALQQAAVPRLRLVASSLTESDLLQTAERNGLIPDEANLAARQAAVDAVATVVCSRSKDALTGSATVCIRLAPVGSFALSVSVSASDVDCLAVGNISSDTFWELMRSRLRAVGWPNSHNIRLRRFVKDATVRMMELSVGDIKVDLQYCPAPRVAESWDSIPTLPSDSSIFSLPVSSLRTLNAYRDSLALRALVPAAQLPAFELAHRSLRHFCQRRGIWASKYGYLGSFHLSILLVRLLGLLPPSVSAPQLVRSFVSHYSSWAWDTDAVYVGPAREYARSGREAMVILSPEKPSLNVSSSASRSSVQVITRVLKDAEHLLANGANWDAVCGTGLGAFLSSHQRFAKIDVTYWGPSSTTGRGLVGHPESRFVHLLVQLQTALSGVNAELWPERLADGTSTDQDGSLQAFYLVGLSGPNLDATVQTRLALLEAFAEDIRGHARFYDPVSCFVYASEVTDDQLGAVVVDTFVWPDGGIDEAEAEESDDDDEATRADIDGYARSSEFALSRKKKDKKAKAAARRDTPPTAATSGTAKLRSSADVYNRLMWDSSVSREDYMIGYEDRFKGVKEMPLGSWKREVEDEAFIPFHRVVHFRRKSDNVYVWDRAKRIDLLFGSGITLASS